MERTERPPWWRRRDDGSYWYHNPHRRVSRTMCGRKKDGHKYLFGGRYFKNCGRKPHFRTHLPMPVKRSWVDMQGNHHTEWKKVWDEEPGWRNKGGRRYRCSERWQHTVKCGYSDYRPISRYPKHL